MEFDVDEMKALESLYSAILALKTTEELHLFFEDLCSRNELCSMLHRWQILELINEGKSYEEIIQELAPEESSIDVNCGEKDTKKGKGRNATKVSSTTISRVKACYNNPNGGYRIALGRLKGDTN
ncbi:MAG: YerC/YecD family TrpR-related protein [Saccharofermentans sp.]|nr:YerC/YecD family TrpR-related protein [Saccharofermentans sp.]